eukprot:scaffold5301_cov126-Cylindrotheca_fusiformis.AAC.5
MTMITFRRSKSQTTTNTNTDVIDVENPSTSPDSSTNPLRSQSFTERFDDDNSSNSTSNSQKPSRWLWKRQMNIAKEHGGDYGTRLALAARTALGSGVIFSALTLNDWTNSSGMVWVGNIWFLVNVSTSFGASLTGVLYFARSIIITKVVVSWPLEVLFHHLQDEGKDQLINILFPFVMFAISFLILTCPQLTGNTVMMVLVYIFTAAPIANPLFWMKPFNIVYVGFICLAVAVLMNVAPFPNFALRTTRNKLEHLEKDLTRLLLAIKDYSSYVGTDLKRARESIATIEFMYTRVSETINTLQTKLPATSVELKLVGMCSGGGGRSGQDLVEWIQHARTFLEPMKRLRSAFQHRMLGEDHSPSMSRAKAVLHQHFSPSRDRLVDATISSIALCHSWTDPSEHVSSVQHQQQREELRTALQEGQKGFHQAICKATDEIGSIGSCHERSKEQQSLFAHTTRRMSAFHSIVELAENVLTYLEQHNEAIQSRPPPQKPCFRPLLQFFSMVWAFCKRPWKWRNPDDLHMAIKISVGMMLASLFVSIPYLKDFSAPYAYWPGITVATVSLPSRGSSFIKAADRLIATMIAGAFSLMVGDFFPGNHSSVRIVALTLFSFIMVYLRDKNHAYMFTYSIISVSCMLFGSAASDYNIAGYVPKRIELIFVGLLIFGLLELLLFPRSSRKVVETAALDFISATRDFLKQAVKCSQQMETFVNDRALDDQNAVTSNEDPFDLNELAQAHAELKALSSRLGMETDPALSEPSFGFGMPLHPSSFRKLVANESDTERQAALLCDALGTLAEYYQQGGHGIRDVDSNWPHVHTDFLQDTADCMDIICELLDAAFVDGRLRVQQGNSMKAVNAAASFRSLEDVRLKVVPEWSDSFHKFVRQDAYNDSDPHAMMTLGVITTVILEICEQMKQAGRNLEEIAYRFPATQ